MEPAENIPAERRSHRNARMFPRPRWRIKRSCPGFWSSARRARRAWKLFRRFCMNIKYNVTTIAPGGISFKPPRWSRRRRRRARYDGAREIPGKRGRRAVHLDRTCSISADVNEKLLRATSAYEDFSGARRTPSGITTCKERWDPSPFPFPGLVKLLDFICADKKSRVQ